MKMQQILFKDYIIDYEDLGKVVPTEFKEFKDAIYGIKTYFKLQDEDGYYDDVITVQNIVNHLHKRSDVLYDELSDEDLDVVNQVKKPYKNLMKAFVDKTKLTMSLFYSEAQNNVFVEFNRYQVDNEPSKVEYLKSLGVNFRFAEWVEDEWFEK